MTASIIALITTLVSAFLPFVLRWLAKHTQDPHTLEQIQRARLDATLRGLNDAAIRGDTNRVNSFFEHNDRLLSEKTPGRISRTSVDGNGRNQTDDGPREISRDTILAIEAGAIRSGIDERYRTVSGHAILRALEQH